MKKKAPKKREREMTRQYKVSIQIKQEFPPKTLINPQISVIWVRSDNTHIGIHKSTRNNTSYVRRSDTGHDTSKYRPYMHKFNSLLQEFKKMRRKTWWSKRKQKNYRKRWIIAPKNSSSSLVVDRVQRRRDNLNQHLIIFGFGDNNVGLQIQHLETTVNAVRPRLHFLISYKTCKEICVSFERLICFALK